MRTSRILLAGAAILALGACNDKQDDGAFTGDTSGVNAIGSGTNAGDSARAAPDLTGVAPADSSKLDSIARGDTARRDTTRKP